MLSVSQWSFHCFLQWVLIAFIEILEKTRDNRLNLGVTKKNKEKAKGYVFVVMKNKNAGV